MKRRLGRHLHHQVQRLQLQMGLQMRSASGGSRSEGETSDGSVMMCGHLSWCTLECEQAGMFGPVRHLYIVVSHRKLLEDVH
mmetsp:Transcript_24534/g.51256  ORF Transcript_24534/g.51256 Transcript_24534/m.51256 type:complete len:82 (+) Transcript_24534:142-387(+)